MKRNNRGFSLVELIVVVAILGACVGIVTASISTIFSSQARKCAVSIDAAISQCRVNAMSRAGDIYMTLSADNDGVITVKQYEKKNGVDTEIASDAVGNSRCGVSYKSGVTDLALDASGITLSFDRDTGAFDFTKNGNTVVSSITVSGGGRSYVLTLDALTGAHSIGG